jgi:RNA polymerase sigma factor (sigma-70 family)
VESIIEQTFKNEKSRLIRFIRSKILLEEDVEDIFQEVFYKVVVNANVLDSVDNLIGWIYTVTKNKIIDFYRKKRNPTVSINNHEEDFSLEELIEDTVTDIEDDYIKSIIYDEIIEAINELPDDQKKVFVENEIEGKSFKELSKETGVPINTLLARKRYAVLKLKDKLQNIKELVEE